MVAAKKAGVERGRRRCRPARMDALKRVLRTDFTRAVGRLPLQPADRGAAGARRAPASSTRTTSSSCSTAARTWTRSSLRRPHLARCAERPAVFAHQPRPRSRTSCGTRVVFKLVKGKQVFDGIRGDRTDWNGLYLGSSNATTGAVWEALLRVDPTNAQAHAAARRADRAAAAPTQRLRHHPRQPARHRRARAVPGEGDHAAAEDARSPVAGRGRRWCSTRRTRRRGGSTERRAAAHGDGRRRAGGRAGAGTSTCPRRRATGRREEGGAHRHAHADLAAPRRQRADAPRGRAAGSDAARCGLGDVLEIHAQLVNDEPRHHVALVVPVRRGPRAAEPEPRDLSAATPSPRRPTRCTATYVQRLDQEVRYYFTELPRGTFTFHFRVRASSEGSFVHPPPWAELMYREEVRGRGAGHARRRHGDATRSERVSAAQTHPPGSAGREGGASSEHSDGLRSPRAREGCEGSSSVADSRKDTALQHPDPRNCGNEHWMRPSRDAASLLAALARVRLSPRSLTARRSLATRPSHLLLDRAGRYLGEVPGSDEAYGYWPLPEVLPEKIVVTTLETEDRHFYEHGGVHLPSVARALWQNLRQPARHLRRVDHRRCRWRACSTRSRARCGPRLREAAEALLLVDRHGHDAVLRQYLTLAPYGNRCHGVVRAARLYFDKPVEDLSWLQAAFLAALPQQPGRMSPWTTEGHARALKRARRILQQLHARGVISTTRTCAWRSKSDLGARAAAPAATRRRCTRCSPSRAAPKGGARGRHTSHPRPRRAAHRARRARPRTSRRWRDAGAGNTAVLVVDLPDRRRARLRRPRRLLRRGAPRRHRLPRHEALAGLRAQALHLRAWRSSAARTPRPPSCPTRRSSSQVARRRRLRAREHHPQLPRADAAAPGARQLAQHPRAARAVGRGRRPRRRAASSAAGVQGVRVRRPRPTGCRWRSARCTSRRWELATLYTALANQGETVPLRRFARRARRSPARALSRRDAAMLIAHILADPEARRPGFPAGGPLDFDYAVAVKTGTSQGYRDAWASGVLSDRLLVVAWVGNHDWRRMNLASGATAAAPAAAPDDGRGDADARAAPGRGDELPAAPAHAVSVEVCALSGRLPGPGCTHTEDRGLHPRHRAARALPVPRRGGARRAQRPARRPVVPEALRRRRGRCSRCRRPTRRGRGSQRLAIAPTAESPLCPSEAPASARTWPSASRARTRATSSIPTRRASTPRCASRPQVTPATEDDRVAGRRHAGGGRSPSRTSCAGTSRRARTPSARRWRTAARRARR